MTAPTHVPAPDPTPARDTYYPLNDPRVTAAVDALYEARKAVVAEMLYAQYYRSYSPAEHQRLIAASSAAATNARAAIYDLAAALVADGLETGSGGNQPRDSRNPVAVESRGTT